MAEEVERGPLAREDRPGGPETRAMSRGTSSLHVPSPTSDSNRSAPACSNTSAAAPKPEITPGPFWTIRARRASVGGHDAPRR